MSAPGVVTAHPRPQPEAPRPYRFPEFTSDALPNGVQLVVAPIRKLPIVTVLAVIEAGAVTDPAGREGVAQITAAALGEGAGGLDAAELDERFERIGAAFDASADWDVAIARLTVGSARLAEAMRLFGQVMTAPALPEREIERLKAERLAELLQQRTEPRGLADDMFARVLYAEESRYRIPEGGEESSVRTLTREEVLAFYTERYRPAATTLVIVGDVDPEQGRALAEQALGGWSGETPLPGTAVDQPARLERALHLVDKPDAPQAELRIGHVGLPRLHPDYFATTVMNALLGGLFSSRINLNLRERHGYTYGAFSHFDWRRGAGPFLVSTAVANDVTHLAAREVLHELGQFGTTPVDDHELRLATDYLDGVFPIRFETTAAIAGALAGLVTYGLPADYYDSYRRHVRAVTPEDVQAAARRHLHLDRLQLLVVGSAAALREPLASLGFGPITLYDSEGRAHGPA